MSRWNPDANDTLGLQWFPTTESSITLDSPSKIAAMSLLQSASQVIGEERVWLGSIPTRGGVYAVEVYDGEDAVPVNDEILTARPNEDVTLNAWTEDDGTTTSIFSEIDESTLNLADYIRSPVGAPAAATAQYVHRYSTGGLSLTGKRILSVSVGVVVSSVPGSKINNICNVGVWIGGVFYPIGTVQARSSTFDLGYFTMVYNPNTGAPWTIADVQAFDTASAVAFWVNNVAFSRVYVYQAYMDVVAVTENRIAVGVLDDRSSGLTAGAYNAAAMLTPAGGAWTKDGSGRHLYTLRRTNDAGRAVIPTLSSGEIPDVASGFSPTVDPSLGFVTEMGDAHGTLFGLLQRTTAPADSVDSQSYVGLVEASVFTGQDAEQEITGVAADYGRVRARVKPNSATADLLIKIKKRSDNSQVGTTYTLTPAAAAALPSAGGWKVLDVKLATNATLTAVQYYVEFSSTAASGLPWSVLALDTGDQGNTATFGGTTDRALVNGTEADRYDLAVTVSTLPIAPAGLAVAVATQSRDATIRGTTTFEYATATWEATSLAGSFERYELERSEDGGTTWRQVAWITTEATEEFDDYEAPRGVAVSYRLRVVRADGGISDWVTF